MVRSNAGDPIGFICNAFRFTIWVQLVKQNVTSTTDCIEETSENVDEAGGEASLKANLNVDKGATAHAAGEAKGKKLSKMTVRSERKQERKTDNSGMFTVIHLHPCRKRSE